ncbi:MAG: hypothetical protein LBC60_03895 [Spirochaetaceae bacterium]|nr:hypothetical protein [Spirochaetaceae bacterium]
MNNTIKDYDFTGKDPNAVLTKDEFEHFDEGMSLKNKSMPSGEINFRKAVESVVNELDSLLP